MSLVKMKISLLAIVGYFGYITVEVDNPSNDDDRAAAG